MKYRTMNQGVATTCATCDDVGILRHPSPEYPYHEMCPCSDCGTEDNPHQWAQVPHPDDTCGRCGRTYKACGMAWHEVGR